MTSFPGGSRPFPHPNVLGILRHAESVFEQLEGGVSRPALIVNAYHVKAPLRNPRHPPQVLPRHRRELPLLLPVDRRLPRLHLVRSPRLHLDKTQHIVLPPDKVDLPAPPRRAIIACHHHISALSQIKVGILFPAPSHALVDRTLRGRKVSLR